MLTLKMMKDSPLPDADSAKQFVLWQAPAGSQIEFLRCVDGSPSVLVSYPGGIESFSPGGNTYVMQDGKTIATFAHSE